MLEIIPVKSFPIAEHSGRFLKGDAVFLEVGNGFALIPREHINVYTLIMRRGPMLFLKVATPRIVTGKGLSSETPTQPRSAD